MRIIDADEAVRTLKRMAKDCIFTGKLQEGEEYAIAACVLNRKELADELSGRDINNHIQQLEAQVPKWISVVEQEPPEGSYVLAASDEEGEVPAVVHIEKGGWAAVWAENFGESVHSYWRGGAMFWMPLPEPPKEENHGV